MMATLAVASSAQAISYDITSDHATGGLGTPPFGTVTLTQNGANLDVSVALNQGYSWVLTGAGDSQDFKFNATGVALSDISITQNAPSGVGTLTATTGTYNGDGTGNFGFGIAGSTQKNGGAGAFTTPINFSIANATIADLTQPNNLGIIFVADLLNVSTGSTGPADVTASVPDGGATVAMLGAALVGLGSFRKMIRK